MADEGPFNSSTHVEKSPPEINPQLQKGTQNNRKIEKNPVSSKT